MTYIIDRNKFQTELGKITYDELIKISDDSNFLISILIAVKGDERKKDLLDWLEKHPNVIDEDVENYVNEKYYSEYL